MIWPCPPERQDQVHLVGRHQSLPSGSLTRPTSATRGQTLEARRTIILQSVERNPQIQKVRQTETTPKYVLDEGTRRTPEEQLSEVELGNLPEKEFRITTVKMIQDLRKRMTVQTGEIQEMFNKEIEDLKKKKQANIDEQYSNGNEKIH